MNYLKVYCNLIRKAENRTPPEGYTEKHHTFPVSIFGKNKRIVVLTAREHYIAHALLEKICIQRYGDDDWKTKKMNFAHCLMISGENRYHNSYLYENAKVRMSNHKKGQVSAFLGRKHTEKSKEKLRNIRLGTKHTEETKSKMSNQRKGELHPMFGKKRPDTVERNRQRKGKKLNLSENVRKSKSKKMKGKRNPMYDKKGKNNPNYGKKWWNNGVEHIFCFECPGENWVRGMLPNKINKNKK